MKQELPLILPFLTLLISSLLIVSPTNPPLFPSLILPFSKTWQEFFS